MKRMLALGALLFLLSGGKALAAEAADEPEHPVIVQRLANQPMLPRWTLWFARIPTLGESSLGEPSFDGAPFDGASSAEPSLGEPSFAGTSDRIQWDWTLKGFLQALFGWADAPEAVHSPEMEGGEAHAVCAAPQSREAGGS